MAAASTDLAKDLALVIEQFREAARQITALKQDNEKERKRRTDAEAREAKLLAGITSADNPEAASESTTAEQLALDVSNALENLNADYLAILAQCNEDSDITEASRLRITSLVQTSAIDRSGELTAVTKAQADYLRQQSMLHRSRAAILRGTRDLAESQLCQIHNTSIDLMQNPNLSKEQAAHVISDVQSAIQAATLKFKDFIRRVRFPVYTEDGRSDDSDYMDHRNRLDSTDFLGLPKILEDFGTAVDVLCESDDARTVRSLREQLRIEKLSSFNAQRHARVATLALKAVKEDAESARAREAEAIADFERVGSECEDLAQKLQRCHQHGEEMRGEIIKLQEQLRIAGLTSNISAQTAVPGRPQMRRQPLTSEEVHELDKVLGNFAKYSDNYHSIIKDLEQRLTDLAQAARGDGSESDQIGNLRATISTLISDMRGKEKLCEEQKRRLKDQIENLVKQSALVDTYSAEIARLNALINSHNANSTQRGGQAESGAELAAKLSQCETTIAQNIGQGMQVSGTQQDQHTISLLQAERTEFRRQRNDLQAQLDNLQAEHHKVKEKLHTLTKEKSVDETEKQRLRAELGVHETSVSRLKKELTDTKEKLKISDHKLKDCLKHKNARPPTPPPPPPPRTPSPPPAPSPSPPPAPRKRRRNPGSRLVAEIAENAKRARSWGYIP